MSNLFFTYLIIINTLTIFIFGLDNLFAINHKRRISEKTLITLSLFGGCFLEFISMFLFRHKTLKIKFYIINIILIILYLLCFIFII